MKKLLLSAAVAALALSANAEGWYVSGNFQGWSHCNPDYELKATETAGVYALTLPADMELAGEFLIFKGEPETPNWDTKIGSNGDNVVIDEKYYYQAGGSNFVMDGVVKGATLTLDENEGSLLVTGQAQENEYTTIYMIGDFGNGWSETDTTYPLALAAGTDNVWEGNYSYTAETSYFKFKAGNFIYGFNGDADGELTMGEPMEIAKAGQAIKLPAGSYKISLSLAKNAQNGTLVVSDATAISEVEADDAAAVYYNLQGVRVANPQGGLFIKVTGDKAVKTFVK